MGAVAESLDTGTTLAVVGPRRPSEGSSAPDDPSKGKSLRSATHFFECSAFSSSNFFRSSALVLSQLSRACPSRASLLARNISCRPARLRPPGAEAADGEQYVRRSVCQSASIACFLSASAASTSSSRRLNSSSRARSSSIMRRLLCNTCWESGAMLARARCLRLGFCVVDSACSR